MSVLIRQPLPWSRATDELGHIHTCEWSPRSLLSTHSWSSLLPHTDTKATLTQPGEWGREKDTCPRCKTLSKWKSFLDFNPETRVFLLCWPFQASPLYPTAKMSCRKRCKREIFKFAQYLFRLITGTLNTGKTLTGVFAAVLLNLRRFLYLHLSSFVLLLLNVFIIFFFFLTKSKLDTSTLRNIRTMQYLHCVYIYSSKAHLRISRLGFGFIACSPS